MAMAYRLARKTKGQTSPNPMVGAVIVKNDRVVAAGYHQRCGSDHAEVMALKKAGKNAKGARLYVTLEPCSHFGRTPPCVDAIIQSGIKEVIVGMMDPNPINHGKSMKLLGRRGIKVRAGFLENELKVLNEVFIKFIKYRMPFVVVKWAQTLDGKIASAGGQSRWITAARARDFSRSLRAQFDAILVGIETVLKDNPGLNAGKKSRPLKKVIVDSSLRIPLTAKLFQGIPAEDIIIATTGKASSAKLKLLRKKDFRVIVCPQAQGRVDLKYLLKELARLEITSIFVEGGSQILGSLFKARLVDKVLCFIAPKIMGDEQALSAVRGFSIKKVDESVRLHNISMERIGDDYLMKAYVYRNH